MRITTFFTPLGLELDHCFAHPHSKTQPSPLEAGT